MKLGTLVQFGALNIVRHGAITKAPPGGHGSRFNIVSLSNNVFCIIGYTVS